MKGKVKDYFKRDNASYFWSTLNLIFLLPASDKFEIFIIWVWLHCRPVLIWALESWVDNESEDQNLLHLPPHYFPQSFTGETKSGNFVILIQCGTGQKDERPFHWFRRSSSQPRPLLRSLVVCQEVLMTAITRIMVDWEAELTGEYFEKQGWIIRMIFLNWEAE